MPSYVGIGSSITHNVEVDGNLFLQDIEGGPDSTRVPLEIFSNLVSSSVESANSRMLRLRVQNYGETDTSNSYVTDMGIRGGIQALTRDVQCFTTNETNWEK